MADVKYQIAVASGDRPEWTPGQPWFDKVWDVAHDRLRFHRGDGFAIAERPGEYGRARPLNEVREHLHRRIDAADLETVFAIRALSDKYTLLMRRHAVFEDKGEQVVAQAAVRVGTPYVFGATDCSWLTKACVAAVTGIDLPHNAAAQHADDRVHAIAREDVRPGDLVFIDDLHHVAIFKDWKYGGRVWDTEPHSTSVPADWMPDSDGQLGTGVRIRPMFLPWYCGRIDSFGRIHEVNGPA